MARRCKMRKLLDDINSVDRVDASVASQAAATKKLVEQMDNFNEENAGVLDQVANTFLDLQIYGAIASKTYECVCKVTYTTCLFDAMDFANKLKDLVTSNQDTEFSNDALSLLGPQIFNISRISHTIPEVLPTLSYESIQPLSPVAKVARVAKQPLGEKHKPLKVNLEEEAQTSTKNIPNKYYKALVEKNGPVNYQEFTVDKTSFNATVKNMFYLSFLFNEDKAKMELDENQKCVVTPLSPPSNPDGEVSLVKTKQRMVVRLSMEEWSALQKP